LLNISSLNHVSCISFLHLTPIAACMTVASSSEIYLFSFPLAALSCSESAGVQGRARSRHSCHIRGKSRCECRASIGSRTYLRSRTVRPLLFPTLFSHCFARTICQSPSVLNILHLSVMHNSDFSQLLSWLVKSLDSDLQLLFPPSSKATLHFQSPRR
jgi:hypothetical protein